jgi:hypothetical protein
MDKSKDNAATHKPPAMAVIKPEDKKAQSRSVEEQKKHGQFPIHDEEIGGG